ncbi:hypothetical protein [Streptomyces yangpuensis]|uniref:hypothetical protein n=1 Tax=Streptomyces yangpuensis TaxID=1648182 RepID=UPI003662753E
MTAKTPGRRGLRARAERARAAWWALPGRDRIAVEGFLLTGLLFAAAWRAGHLGMAQADFVLSVLSGTAGVATLYRGGRPPAAVRPASSRAAGRAVGGSPAARRPRSRHRARRLCS